MSGADALCDEHVGEEVDLILVTGYLKLDK
jgi:hypothetical protein